MSAVRSSLATGQSHSHSDAEPAPTLTFICLLLWLCDVGALDPRALRLIGIEAPEQARLRQQYASQLDDLRQRWLCGAMLQRQVLAPMLRARVLEMSLTAGTPAELAAVARAVKTLPDWVWDDATVDGDVGTGLAPSAASPGSQASAAAPRRGQDDLGAANLADAASRVPTADPPLNRHQRRTLDKLQRSR